MRQAKTRKNTQVATASSRKVSRAPNRAKIEKAGAATLCAHQSTVSTQIARTDALAQNSAQPNRSPKNDSWFDEAAESGVYQLPAPPLTVREAASILSLSEDVTRSQLRSGKLRGFRAGGHWRVPPHSISEYITLQLSTRGGRVKT